VVDWGNGVFASCSRWSTCPLARAIWMAAFALQHHCSCQSTDTSESVKRGWFGYLLYKYVALYKNPPFTFTFLVGPTVVKKLL